MTSGNGFIVASWAAGSRILATGRLESGESFALASRAGPGAVLVPATYEDAAAAILARFGARRDPEAWADMDGSGRVRFSLPGGATTSVERALLEGGVPMPVLDRGGVDAFLSERGIASGIAIRGEARKGDRVDLIFVDPELGPSDARPSLRWLALDIETDRQNRVVAVSLVLREYGEAKGPGAPPPAPSPPAPSPPKRSPSSPANGEAIGTPERSTPERSDGEGEVLFWGPELGLPWLRSFDDEGSLLRAMDERIVALDPDVVTGWNLIEFDLAVLLARHADLGIPFTIGRSRDPARFIERPGKSRVFDLPGRAVLDGMRLMRSAGERFEDQSLETVSRTVLGEGKIVASTGEDKLAELERLRAEEPILFCEYCLRDSDLVLRILAATGIAVLTAGRAALTGLPLDLAWTSIPAFERVYDAALRARRIVAPGRELRPVSGAAGGTVLEPRAGIFEGVIVLDFRSLYPSLMRTFNIDPLSHARSGDRDMTHVGVRGARKLAARVYERGNDEAVIMAPNGAKFSRAPGILPGIIARYTVEREAALARGDERGAYVYKILMNSFYGVLGADGCRYARRELAGAITSFARRYLTFARDFLEGEGYRILYGDTDSVFVETGLPASACFDEMRQLGEKLAGDLNEAIAADVRECYGVDSFLKIRADKIYARFLIPRLRFEGARVGSRGGAILGRGSPGRDAGEAPGIDAESSFDVAPGPLSGEGEEGEGDEAARGRAKGYAGLKKTEGDLVEVEVRGMEAARSDGTDLGRRFQLELLSTVFGAGNGGAKAGSREVAEAYCRGIASALRAGELDDELVYRRWLRRPASEYGSENPAVRAARILGWTNKRGRISWVMTKAGAEPPERRSGALLDYEHYIERQLIPIASAIGDEAGWDPRPWLADRPQMELWQ
ncbi:MAG: DNA polymerase II [Treponema sp.]|nr:DNA polymerase II [Treponema sp.]